jgi:anti-sigma factor RsiW
MAGKGVLMNTPHKIREQLILYADNLLSDKEKRQVETLLAEDAALREELDYLIHIRSAIKSRPSETPPGLWPEIEAQILEESQGLWSHMEWAGKRLVPLFAAAAVVMLAVLGSLNGEDTDVTLDAYFQDQEGIILSELDSFDNNVLGVESSEVQ